MGAGMQRPHQGVGIYVKDNRKPCQCCEHRSDLLRFAVRMMNLVAMREKLGHWCILGDSFS